MSLNKLQEHKGELAKIMPSLPEVTTSIYLSKVYDYRVDYKDVKVMMEQM